MSGPGFGRMRRERFIPLPILASVAFIVLVAGQQYYFGPANPAQEAGTGYGPYPNVATAWIKMQGAPRADQDESYIVARDTLAVISPFPGPGVESCVVYFTSLQGVPFTMWYVSWLWEYYGVLYPGVLVYAYFTYSEYEAAWRLLFVSVKGDVP